MDDLQILLDDQLIKCQALRASPYLDAFAESFKVIVYLFISSGNKHFVTNWWNSNFTRRPYFKMRYNERINLSQIYWKTLQGYKKWSHIKNWSHDDKNDYKILKNDYFLLIEPFSYLIPSRLPHRAFTTLAFGLVAYKLYSTK